MRNAPRPKRWSHARRRRPNTSSRTISPRPRQGIRICATGLLGQVNGRAHTVWLVSSTTGIKDKGIKDKGIKDKGIKDKDIKDKDIKDKDIKDKDIKDK